MLQIELNDKLLTVTRGAYEAIYAPAGWKVKGEEKAKKRVAGASKTVQTDLKKEADPWDEVDDDNIDLESMNAKALKRLAREKGLNPDEYKTLGEIRKALKPLV